MQRIDPAVQADNQTATATVPQPTGSTADRLAAVVSRYRDDKTAHEQLYRSFEAAVAASPELTAHRDFVDRRDHGYGDRAFHHLWQLLVEQMTPDFRFLEIGVYKGQVLSLIRLLARMQGKDPRIVGVSPLTAAGDQFSRHDTTCDYRKEIADIHAEFGLDLAGTCLLEGFSQDEPILQAAASEGPYDIIYVDGCHELDVVTSDLSLYPIMLKPGGFLVVDDAGQLLDLPEFMYGGIGLVSIAAAEIIDKDPEFEPLFSCGHNRVWRKTTA